MNKLQKIFYFIICLFVMTGCKQNKKPEPEIQVEGKPKGKILVIYYSQTGATRALAEKMCKQLKIADIEEITLQDPYPSDFNQTIQRCQQEKAQKQWPKLNPLKLKIEDYDLIFLGYPVWFDSYANPIESLLQEASFKGKKLVPFCTFGSGGKESSFNDLKKKLPQTEIWPGYGIRDVRVEDAAHDEIDRFLKENEIIAGVVDPLPEYSGQQPLTAKEEKIFQQACGDYPMLHATPQSASQRKLEDGTMDYLFIAKNKEENGTMKNIQVRILDEANKKPVFTEVIR